MAIVNLSPDSFFSTTHANQALILQTINYAIQNHAQIIDIGACSTRPNSTPVTEEQELQLLIPALTLVRKHYPNIIISLDTFRSKVALNTIKTFNIDIINDISGAPDETMLNLLKQQKKAYILTFNEPLNPTANILSDCLSFFNKKINLLRQHQITDIILDPGFGFNKTIEQNFLLLNNLHILKHFSLPILAGISHKSMLYKTLHTTPQNAAFATNTANTIAILKGANIIRAHDPHNTDHAIQIIHAITLS